MVTAFTAMVYVEVNERAETAAAARGGGAYARECLSAGWRSSTDIHISRRCDVQRFDDTQRRDRR